MDATTVEVINATLSPKDAEAVIAALDAAAADPGVGTVLRNPATGDIATYVSEYTETYWRVVSADDRSWTEFKSLIGWDVLFEATDVVTGDAESGVDAEPKSK